MARATMTRTITLRPRSHRAVRFGLVGLSGLAVNQVVLAALSELLGVHYLLAAIGATQFSSSWNFVGTERWAFSGRLPSNSLGGRFARFMALNNATLLGRLPILWLFTEVGGIHYLWANAVSLGLVFLVRFAASDGWIWSSGAEPESMPAPVVARGQPFLFSIAGLLRIESDVMLRELAYFRTEEPGTPDLVIRVGRVGALPIRKTRFVESGQILKYLEQLGAASANFQVIMGEPIEVRVAPLLARSPHVLYTNVIEALLRFLLVSRGHVLLHSACMMVNGRAVLLSAETDTGKTSTVIQLVRDRKYQFLSDDMTIISPDGVAIHYPKPMTMSYHTMSAISGHRLPMRQRAALAIQSRLHSKSGRTVGRRLGEMNIPIMSINSVVQWMVPPPKYHIAALIDCELAERAPIGHVFIMDRGPALQDRIDPADAVETLIENTDDAYGFPPFSTFAPHLRIGSDDYEALRRKESELLRRAVARADVWHVRVPGHEWSEVLPTLIEPEGPRAIPSEADETASSRDIPIISVIPVIPIAEAEELTAADPLAS